MWTLFNFASFVFASSLAVWEGRNVWRRHGFGLGLSAGGIVFGGVLLWLRALQAFSEHDEGSVLNLAQTFAMLVAPPIATLLMARRAGFAAGVFMGVVAGACVWGVAAMIALTTIGK